MTVTIIISEEEVMKLSRSEKTWEELEASKWGGNNVTILLIYKILQNLIFH